LAAADDEIIVELTIAWSVGIGLVGYVWARRRYERVGDR
jgi:hypothetical protein